MHAGDDWQLARTEPVVAALSAFATTAGALAVTLELFRIIF
jgi:hypothetical protein